ncbi:ABC transporter ATP-binding protein [Pseudogemmobacter sonorensis]|uniref:ABC transporter ATP-binding protein n=1 Tax=Pseudogemmobacter sonorensis TaxID=2989681 RepID=UPI0036A56059
MAELELKGLRKVYAGNVALERFDLTVETGEMIAFLGPSGCGKTTTLRMVAGFVEPSEGTIQLRGKDITALPPEKRDMGMVFQSYALFPHMTVRQNVMFGLKCRSIGKDEAASRADQVLQSVGLTELAGRYPKQMSGGQQQRVALARVLALRPSLLLFDEPLSNLDAKLRVQMRQEIRDLQQQSGITALFVTHDQEEAMTIADRIVVMNKGCIEQVGAPAEIYERPSTRFVADFVGSANIFEGSLTGGSFRADNGLTFDLSALPPAAAARPALLLRPEKIAIAIPGMELATPERLTAKVHRAIKLGGVTEYVLHTAEGAALLVHNQVRGGAMPVLQPGAEVRVGWHAEDLHLLA